VLQVPVRFTEAAPKDVREQFAPMNLATVAAGPSGALSMPLPTIQQDSHSAPVLPAYAQLFREDGSRLADEGEDLPQYPGPAAAMAAAARGAVSAGSPRLGGGVSRSRASSIAGRPASGVAAGGPLSNHVLPSSIYDEAPDAGSPEAAERDQERELQELRSEAEMLAVHVDDASSEDEDMLRPSALQRSRLDETINASDLEEGEHGALMHSSSDHGTHSPLPHGGDSTTDTSRRGSVATGLDSGHGSSSPRPRGSQDSARS
jgi:hypothetical protein